MKKMIFVLFVLFTCSNCALMGMSSPDDFQKAKAQSDVIRTQAVFLDAKYVGLPKESVIDELGKPFKILKEDSPYFLDQNCRKNGCPLGKSDEFWIYEFRKKNEAGVLFYQILVFIKENKIVRIE